MFKCILGLNEIKSKVFSYLLKKNNVTTMELTQLFEKDRIPFQRGLQHLGELNLIDRKVLSLRNYNEKINEEDISKCINVEIWSVIIF